MVLKQSCNRVYLRLVRTESAVSEEHIAYISRAERRQAEHAHGVTTQKAVVLSSENSSIIILQPNELRPLSLNIYLKATAMSDRF
jgi:hypothetical protein